MSSIYVSSDLQLAGIRGAPVVSRGIAGTDWVNHLKDSRYNVDNYATELLQNDAFVATDGVTYQFGLIRSDEFEDEVRTTENIRAEAVRRGWLTPHVECAPLLREAVSDEVIGALGLRFLPVMHEPIKGPDGCLRFLGLRRTGEGRLLSTFWGDASRPKWHLRHGFIFLIPQMG